MEGEIKFLNGKIEKVIILQFKIQKSDILINEKLYKKEEIQEMKINDAIVYERIRNENEKFTRIEDFNELKGIVLRFRWTDINIVKRFSYESDKIFPYRLFVYNKERDTEIEKSFRTLEDMKKEIIKHWWKEGGYYYES